MGAALALSNLAADNGNVLATANFGVPRLHKQKSVNAGYYRPRLQVDAVKIVQQSHRFSSFHRPATLVQRLIVSVERGCGVTFSIDDFELTLRSRLVVTNGLDRALQLAVVDRGGKYALATITNPFRQSRSAPAKFGAYGDLAQSFCFARK